MQTFHHRSRRLLLGLAIGVLASTSIGSTAMSTALFSDQEVVNNTFTSGSITLNPASIAALSLTATNIMPGDNITGAVVVQNDGTSQLRYSISTASTNADTKSLRTVLTLTVKTVDVTTPLVPCDNFDGTTTVLAATALWTGSAGVAIGNPLAGPHTGDRNLNATASETLCLRVNLPQATVNAFQSSLTTTTFTFDAEQTANN